MTIFMKSKVLSLLVAIVASLFVTANAQDASMYMKYANRGDKDAMYNLADCFWSGKGGVSQDYELSLYWYTKAAKRGHQPSQFMVAFCYLYGIGTNQSWVSALEYANKAIAKGYSAAYWIKAQLYKDKYLTGPIQNYENNLVLAAKGGYGRAQSELGALLLTGSEQYSIAQDDGSGYYWISQAADNNDDEGLLYLGICYDRGIRVTASHEKAMEYYNASAQLGNAAAQAMVGYAYLTGDGVTTNYTTAYQYLKAAADQGNSYAYGKIGDIYYYGLGVEVNYNTALEMYKYAANHGDAYSMCCLAYMYGYGIGASEDNALMYKYYKQAADLGNAVGQCGLGDCYMNGYGVAKNEYTAYSWYKKSADQNNARALYLLAYCYKNGTGVEKYTYSYIVYLRKAADLSYAPAMSSLAFEYYSGEYIMEGKNYTKATELFTKAAELGDTYSQCVLGYSYYKGSDPVSGKNYSEAFKYLSMAVQNTDFEYQDEETKAYVYHDLAGCYRYGRGTDADQSLASYYTELAAKYGNVDSKRASNLLRRMHDDK